MSSVLLPLLSGRILLRKSASRFVFSISRKCWQTFWWAKYVWLPTCFKQPVNSNCQATVVASYPSACTACKPGHKDLALAQQSHLASASLHMNCPLPAQVKLSQPGMAGSNVYMRSSLGPWACTVTLAFLLAPHTSLELCTPRATRAAAAILLW